MLQRHKLPLSLNLLVGLKRLDIVVSRQVLPVLNQLYFHDFFFETWLKLRILFQFLGLSRLLLRFSWCYFVTSHNRTIPVTTFLYASLFLNEFALLYPLIRAIFSSFRLFSRLYRLYSSFMVSQSGGLFKILSIA